MGKTADSHRGYTWLAYGVLCAAAFVILLFCTKNSPLYGYNTWVDAQAFFTVGKSFVRGVLPYRDLFEQKGPLLYLIYGIASLISRDSLHGVFWMEWIAMSMTCVYAFRLMALKVSRFPAVFGTVLLCAWICSSEPFQAGGSAEEFLLPFLAFSLYSFYAGNPRKLSGYFWNGFTAGCAAMIKFNLLGFWFVWMALRFFELLLKKEWKCSLQACVGFLAGMAVVPGLFALVFSLNGAFFDFVNAYFLFNSTVYLENTSLMGKLMHALEIGWNELRGDLSLQLACAPILLQLVWPVRKVWTCRVFPLLSCLFLCAGIFFGGRFYAYYQLPFELYGIFGILYAAWLLQWVDSKVSFHWVEGLAAGGSILASLLLIETSPNLEELLRPRENYIQAVFGDIIAQDPGPLLNYGFLDMGIYTSSDQIPEFFYFEKQNVSYDKYPDNMDEQNRYIQEGLPKYIVVWSLEELSVDGMEQYSLAGYGQQMFEGHMRTYRLYKKESSASAVEETNQIVE